MRNLVIVIMVIALGIMPAVATAQRGGGRAGGGGGAPARSAPPTRSAPSERGGGFNLSNDVPSTRTPNAVSSTRTPSAGFSGDRDQVGNRQAGFNLSNDVPSSQTATAANRTANNVGNRTGNANVSNRVNDTNLNNRTGNTNVNVRGNDVNANRNLNVHTNGYGYHGRVVANPAYRGPAWGWNHGAVWRPAGGYWGGGFWGPFVAGAATAVVMGSIVNAANHQTYPSYQVSQGSPGAQLLSNYQLQQVSCGPPNLVVIYGPNNGVICANPNNLVAPGDYAVNMDTLTLQAP
jgi:hypothetical protein